MKEISDKQFESMFESFLSLGQKGLSLNHYDLAQLFPEYTPKAWRTFLQLPEIMQHVNEEFEIIKNTELKKMINNSANTNSVGRQKDGPIFIYSYVPLSTEQAFAPNVQELKSDIFDPLKEEKPQWITGTNSETTKEKTELF